MFKYPVQQVSSGIYLVDNFFDNYHLLLDDITQNEDLYFSNPDCCIKRYRSLCDQRNDELLIATVDAYNSLLSKIVSSIFAISACSPNLSTFDAHIYEEGCSLARHKDDYDSNFPLSPNLATTVHYLNDNYSGGEIEFYQEISPIKPTRNGLLIFQSDIEHGTRPVIQGTKIASTRFWKDQNSE